MPVMKWLSIFSWVALANLGLVSASVIHRLAVGSDARELQSDLVSSRQTETVSSSSDDQATGLSAAEFLKHIEAPQLNVSPRPVKDDDPLMAEIRKHSALQFPNDQGIETDQPDSPAQGLNLKLQESQTRLAAVRDLGAAAAALVDLAKQLQASGQVEQSQSAMLRAEELQQMMVQLLQ